MKTKIDIIAEAILPYIKGEKDLSYKVARWVEQELEKNEYEIQDVHKGERKP